MIITIDGPVATGKSTVAQKLADFLGYFYFDTGAMYRAFTYLVVNEKIPLDDEEALKEALNTFNFRIKVRRKRRFYYIGSEDVTKIIRTPEVTKKVSEVSAIPFVREKLVEIQRKLSEGVNAVFEGRDMGSHVFPDAHLKIFLTGKSKERAKRRLDELQAKMPDLAKDFNLDKMVADIEERDRYDSSRSYSPLVKADDAFEIDTTDLTIDEVVSQILECKDALKLRRTFSNSDHSR